MTHDDPSARQWAALAGWWAAGLVAAVVHNGLWATPNVAFLSLIAERPGENPFGGALSGDYLLTNLAPTRLAGLLGQVEPHRYARLHLVVLVLGGAAVVALALRRRGYSAARALAVVLAASPLVTVTMQWLGQPDPLTGLCGVAMALVRRRASLVALGVLAGLSHPEQAAFMAVAVVAVRPFLGTVDAPADQSAEQPGDDRSKRATLLRGVGLDLLAAVGGVLAGRLITEIYLRLSDARITTPRTDWLGYGVEGFAEHHARQPLGLAWTLWGPLWLAIAALAVWVLRQGSSSQRRLALAGGVVALAALVPTAATLDETRVYAVITAPLLVVIGVLGARALEALGARARFAVPAVALAVVAILPGGFATGVTSWRSQLDTVAMAHWIRTGELPDGQHDLTRWLLSPFDFVIPELPEGSGPRR